MIKMIFFKTRISLWYKFFSSIILSLSTFFSYGQLEIDTTSNIEIYKKLFFGINSGVEIENFNIKGGKYSIGYFHNYCKELEITNGIILSTGNAIEGYGPNDKTNNGAYLYFAGDEELSKISNGKSFDAIALEFDFIPNSDSISFDYVFASEEYPEYIKKGLNDVFAFFLSKINFPGKINIAKLPNCDLPITVDNINSTTNSYFFISNTNRSSCIFNSFQFDGLSKKLTAGHKVSPYQKYHLKVCIADVGDGFFDSAVLLKANSFRSSGNIYFSDMKNTLIRFVGEEGDFDFADSSKIIFTPNIEFDFNSSFIKKGYSVYLDNLVILLKKYFDLKLEIDGYSDDIGSADYNLELSYKRAENVGSYLISNDVDKARIMIRGYGSNYPIASNNSTSGRTKNRRVNFILSRD